MTHTHVQLRLVRLFVLVNTSTHVGVVTWSMTLNGKERWLKGKFLRQLIYKPGYDATNYKNILRSMNMQISPSSN